MANGQNVRLPKGGAGNFISEIDESFLENLDQILQREESQVFERTLGGLEDRGFLRSGETFERVAEDVLGPSVERRTSAILPLARESALLGREERLGDEAFDRAKEFEQLQQINRLESMRVQAEINTDLIRLRDSLEPGFAEILGKNFASGLGQSAGAGFTRGVGRAGSGLF